MFAAMLKVKCVDKTYILAWKDPDGFIHKKLFNTNMISRDFSSVLRLLLNQGFAIGSGILFCDRKPRRELKEYILSHK